MHYTWQCEVHCEMSGSHDCQRINLPYPSGGKFPLCFSRSVPRRNMLWGLPLVTPRYRSIVRLSAFRTSPTQPYAWHRPIWRSQLESSFEGARASIIGCASSSVEARPSRASLARKVQKNLQVQGLPTGGAGDWCARGKKENLLQKCAPPRRSSATIVPKTTY